VGELAERVERVVAGTASGVASPIATSLLTAAGIVTGNAELVAFALPAGAFTGAVAAEGVGLVRRAWSDRADRVDRFAEAAAEEMGVPVEELLAIGESSKEVRCLLGVAVEAATEARGDWKIRTLARAFVTGAKDPAVVDELMVLTELLKDVEVADVRLMAQLAKEHSFEREGSESRLFKYLGDLASGDPGLGQVVVPLARKLQMAGFVESEPRDNGMRVYRLTDLGGYLCEQLERFDSLPEPEQGRPDGRFPP